MSDHRIVSWNVLSDALCTQSHYFRSPPEAVDNTRRLELVKLRCLDQIKLGSIISLQEVSSKWAEELRIFFKDHGYRFLICLYGSAFSGNMGVGIAWPSQKYEVTKTVKHRVGKFQELKAASDALVSNSNMTTESSPFWINPFNALF